MYDVVQAIVLGIVQGLTEFLPVSSSGHLVVVPAAFGWDEPSLAFTLVLHLGTLVAVLAYFRDDLRLLITGFFGAGDSGGVEEARRMAWFLVLGTLPATVAGVLFEDFVEELFEEPLWVCGFWLVTAGVLVTAEQLHRRAPSRSLSARLALGIGAAQAVALAPGISRSGATIAAAIAIGLSRTDAARFSFLLAIPAIAGASLVTLLDADLGELGAAAMVGFVASAVVGYLAVAGLLRLIRTRSFLPFAAYLAVASPLAALAVR
ncbi:MAG: undecaprenyl-diphosphatase UppP [Actinobacteria bacterium]|nr:undecaprenyl-diphosphatase UppP [Actinomycetota bacterium]